MNPPPDAERAASGLCARFGDIPTCNRHPVLDDDDEEDERA